MKGETLQTDPLGPAHVNRKHPRPVSRDNDTYTEELDWFFGCWEALIGYRSHMGGVLAKAGAMSTGAPVRGGSHEARGVEQTASPLDMAKGRRVFNRYRQLNTVDQVALSRHYTGRDVDRDAVLAAHVRYSEVMRG